MYDTLVSLMLMGVVTSIFFSVGFIVFLYNVCLWIKGSGCTE
jgi:hypothetical protein